MVEDLERSGAKRGMGELSERKEEERGRRGGLTSKDGLSCFLL